jgi:hypothetical protein
MKRFIPHLILAVFALAPAGAAWAQQQGDLDVTMKVVPADASAGSALSEIKLPDAASLRGQAASGFGQGVAAQAREMKGDLGRDFGQSVSEAAHGKAPLVPPGKAKGH